MVLIDSESERAMAKWRKLRGGSEEPQEKKEN